jgi:hypothetical protein
VRAEQDEKLAEEEAKRTETALSNAKSELSSAESDLFSKKSDASFKKTHFEQTPAKIEVDKHCLHTYAVDHGGGHRRDRVSPLWRGPVRHGERPQSQRHRPRDPNRSDLPPRRPGCAPR